MTSEELDDLYAKFDTDHIVNDSSLAQKRKSAYNLLYLTLEYFKENPNEFDYLACDSVGHVLKYYQHNNFKLVSAYFDRIFVDRKHYAISRFNKSPYANCTIENFLDTFQKIAK